MGEARALYDDCVRALFAANNNVPLPRRPTLQMCEQWYSHPALNRPIPWIGYGRSRWHVTRLRWQREFPYLADTEANHACGGFCEPGPPLWTDDDLSYGREGTRCTRVVSVKLKHIVREGTKLFAISCIMILLTL